MSWFRQNRMLGMLLIVFGICVAFALVLLVRTRNNWIATRAEFNKAAAERNRLEGLDPFPNNANYHKLKTHIENYRVALDKFKEELKREVLPTPAGLAPNEFQSRLRQATVVTLNRARTNNVKLPDRFYLGFEEFATALPKTALAPLLGQELTQIQLLLDILLDAKIDSVTSLHRAPLAEEREVAPAPIATPTPRRAAVPKGTSAEASATVPKLLERNVVDVTFKAAPGAARKVLNELASSSSQFFIIRTLHVRNEKDKGPPRERAAEQPPAGAEQRTSLREQEGPVGPLNFIVGTEHIEVSATIEMVRFMF